MASAAHPVSRNGHLRRRPPRIGFEFSGSRKDPQARAALTEAKIFLTYQRQLNNLSIQENRLRRQREKDLAVLQQLQFHRRQQHEKHLCDAVQLYKQSQEEGWTFKPSDLGFEFTLAQIEDRIAQENFCA